ncbi:MAG: DUF6499 domain-containing protein, partial [Pseudomonadota bacterium]
PTDWRNPKDYAYFADLDATGLAWECLRRNRDYRQAYSELNKGIGTAQEWGLRFPCRSQPERKTSIGGLDTRRGACRRLNACPTADRVPKH